MNLLRDQVYLVTQSSNTNECDVTFEQYCSKLTNSNIHHITGLFVICIQIDGMALLHTNHFGYMQGVNLTGALRF